MSIFAFAGLVILGGLAAFYGWWRNRKMYRTIDVMLGEILDRKPITVSDIREGEISALASKAKQIQEKMEGDFTKVQEEKEQVKSLISNLSHQLKTPLAGLMMYREILEDPSISEQQHTELLRKMKKQSEKISWLLESLFKMVKLEQGVILFDAKVDSLQKTLFQAIDNVYQKAERKGLEIITVPFSDCKVYHNRKWTVEAFENILENAVKYTDQGSITISVNLLEFYTQIDIRDTGMGIREGELNYIFKRFYRSKEVENREGSGIGLYLTRLILEQEQGYMKVSAKQGEGSCFSVFLQNCHNS